VHVQLSGQVARVALQNLVHGEAGQHHDVHATVPNIQRHRLRAVNDGVRQGAAALGGRPVVNLGRHRGFAEAVPCAQRESDADDDNRSAKSVVGQEGAAMRAE
jgi:hypothetical protein